MQTSDRKPVWKRRHTVTSALRQLAFRQVNYSWSLAVIQGTLLICAAYWYQTPSSSNAAVVILALLTVVMAVRAEDKWGHLERAGWLPLAAIVALVAIRATNEEDYMRQRQFASIVEQFRTIMNKENT